MQGLTPTLFWMHRDRLVGCCSAEECEDVVREVVGSSGGAVKGKPLDVTRDAFNWIGTTGIAIGNRSSGDPATCYNHFSAVLNCGAEEFAEHQRDELDGGGEGGRGRYLFLPIPEGKKGQMRLFENLDGAVEFVGGWLKTGGRVLVHCMQ
ncbi:hypothetical protein HDU67_004867, partial [Dinochytrium kinnereticum]